MGKNNYRVWEYEWMLWKKAILDTIAFYQTNRLAWIGNLVGIAATLYAVFVLQGVQAMYNELILLEAGLMGFLATAIFYILVHRMSAPLILYRRRESEVFRKTWKDIEIKKYLFPPEEGIGIGLQIISDKPQKFDFSNADVSIMNIVPAVVSIIQHGIKKEIAQAKLPLLQKTVRGFQAMGGGLINRKLEKENKSLTTFVIANWDQNEAWIVQEDGQRIFTIDDGILCRVEIIINSKIHPPLMFNDMESCQVFCELLYAKNKKGQKRFQLLG